MASLHHGRITSDTWPLIDHRSLARSSSLMSTSRNFFITKWISKQLPVGTIMVQRRHRLYDTCPLCQRDTEDIKHLLTCKSEFAQHVYSSGLEKLSNWM